MPRLFVCLQKSLRRNGSIASVRRGPGHDDFLGRAQRRTVACNPNRRSRLGRERTCRAFVPWSFRSAVEWFDLDAGVPAWPGEFIRCAESKVATQLPPRLAIFCAPFRSLPLSASACSHGRASIAPESATPCSPERSLPDFGYVIWYTALPHLKAASAATVQLSVPVLAATGGILLLGEPLTLRFLFASIAVLGGIALVVIEKQRARKV